ncbi:MAG: CAP domain-containing protein [Candidatus Daviesbacteria bacterium]|nr:CAP domain-containing protein [Candidatus Daviesbacteria bacterium]
MIWQRIHHWFTSKGRNWFIPHKETHKKAHLISWEALLIYIFIFMLLQVGFSILSYTQPGILGISGNIDQQRLIELTNIERQKAGLPPISENSALDQAAALKAQNMFSENYWAHFAPSGKSPWDFISSSGYKFVYAGENLAKNFYSSDDVVVAWMNSPTHRDNLLNPKYKDIGIAVVNGTLDGQQTTLIVQMFGTTTPQYITQAAPTTQPNPPPQVEEPAPPQVATVAVSGKEIAVPKEELAAQPILIGSYSFVDGYEKITKPLLDPFKFFRVSGFSLIAFIATLLALDLFIIYRRRIFRISSHHIAHMSILSIAAASLLTSSPGSIL